MKFPVDKCVDCGLDLTTAEPTEVSQLDNKSHSGTCPKCGRLYFMLEVTPPSLPEPVVETEVVVTPELPVVRGGHRRVFKPEPVPE